MRKQLPLFLLLAMAPIAIFAAEDAAVNEGKSDNAEKKPAVYVVKKGSLDNKVELNALFEAAEMEALAIDPKAWNDLTVVEAIEHGTRVKKGDVLLKLETEKIEEQIADLEEGQASGQIAFEIASLELENLQQTTPLKLEAAERARRRADEDYAYFQDVDKDQREKSVEYGLKSAEQRLENANEELSQLKKMYEADDLTEETEEIILKRQKYSVEAAEYFLESARINAKRTRETTLPREYENLKSQKLEQDLAYNLARETLPRTLDQKRKSLEKLQRDRKKSDQKLSDLKDDLPLLTVRSPIDGIVYYGANEAGKWTTGAVLSKKLVPGGKVAPREVFMTVASPGKLILRTTVPESKLSQLKVGQTGEAVPVSDPDRKLSVRLKELNYIPMPDGSYAATISLPKGPHTRLMPGMNCKVSFGGEENQTPSLLAPIKAVHTEGDRTFVYLQKDENNHERKEVKTGDSDEKMIQITSGLTEGDKILLNKPE